MYLISSLSPEIYIGDIKKYFGLYLWTRCVSVINISNARTT